MTAPIDETDRGVPAHVDGRGDVYVRVEPGRIVFVTGAGTTVDVPLSRVAGLAVVRADDALTLTLHLANGGLLRVVSSAAPFDVVVGQVVGDAFALPELMRDMRAYGAARALPGSEHDRFFAPLVAPLRALRAAHATGAGGAIATPWRSAESVGATRAGAEIRATLSAIAAERFPVSAPDRRALEAELLDESEPLFDALDALTVAAQKLGVASERDRVAAWRAWCAALAATFVAADRAWAAVLPALGEAPRPEPGRWRAARRDG
jgi:hypothetical protein